MDSQEKEEEMTDPNALCVSVLSERIPGLEVSTEVPGERPDGPFVQVSRTGGTGSDFLDEPIMTLVCWASSDAAAYALGIDCVHALAKQAEDDPYLSAAELITMSRDEWGATGQSRYMVQVRLTINK